MTVGAIRPHSYSYPDGTHRSPFLLVSPLFTDVVQCLGTPLLEIKKSYVD